MFGKTPVEAAIIDLFFLERIPREHCWFCLYPLENGQQINQHHLMPIRYIHSDELTHGFHKVTVQAHSFCHALWHQKHDQGNLDWSSYRLAMHDRNYGYGIFASARWLRKGRTPQQLNKFWKPYHPRAAA